MEHKTRKYKTDRQAPHLGQVDSEPDTQKSLFPNFQNLYFLPSFIHLLRLLPHSTSTHNKRPPRTATTKTTPLTMMISQEWTVRKYKCDQEKISDSFPTGSDSGSTKYRRRNSQFPVLSDTLVISHRANNNRTTITYLFKRTLTE